MGTVILVLFYLAPDNTAAREAKVREQIAAIAHSGRVLEIGEAGAKLADPRREIAPGAPPLLTFRYFAGAERRRFGNLDVMLDDAGH